jgi:predicted esterase
MNSSRKARIDSKTRFYRAFLLLSRCVISILEEMNKATKLQLGIIVIFLSLLLSASLLAQEDSDSNSQQPQPTDTIQTLLWHEAPVLSPIIVKLPADYDSTQTYPIIIALHGFGSSSKKFSRIAGTFTDAGYIVMLPEAPYRMPSDKPGDYYSWGLNIWTPPPLTDDPAIDARSVELMTQEHIPAALKRVEEEYRIGKKYLLGFSQGAIYAFATGVYNSNKFDAIIAFGLSGMESIRDWAKARGESISDGNSLPVLLVNGTEDKKAPHEQGVIAQRVLEEEGYNATFHSFEGGHSVPTAELEKCVEWLSQKQAELSIDNSTGEKKSTGGVAVSGVFSPDGPPTTQPKRTNAGGVCIVELIQEYMVSGTLSGTFTIDYRIKVEGPCGSPLGTFDEDWIAHGTFSGTLNEEKVTSSFTYVAHVKAGGEVRGKMVFGQKISGELEVRGNFADRKLSYNGSLTE